MRRSALVIVGNKYLAERARKAGAKRIEYLPLVVDLENYYAEPHKEDSVFTIGWIGSPTTAPYLYEVHPALKELCKGGRARLVLVGSGRIQLDGVQTEILPWSEQTEVADIQGFDVGIMPVPDDPWTRGKCGFKLIQYMACSLPVVASPVGVNAEIVEDSVSGFLATTMSEWVDALGTLRKNRSLRVRMGKAGRRAVEAKYCLQVTAPRLVSLLRGSIQEFK
jgi:glycosyltransferase involved in cell wall biosynthesis